MRRKKCSSTVTWTPPLNLFEKAFRMNTYAKVKAPLFSLSSHSLTRVSRSPLTGKSARKRYSARNPRLDPNPSSDFPTLDPFPPPASPSHIMTSAIGKSNMCSDLVLHPPAFSGHSHGNEKKKKYERYETKPSLGRSLGASANANHGHGPSWHVISQRGLAPAPFRHHHLNWGEGDSASFKGGFSWVFLGEM